MLADNVWVEIFDSPFSVGIVAIVMGCLVGIAHAIGQYYHRVVRTRYESLLKRDMLDRGMSVEEIERVIRATAEPDDGGAHRKGVHFDIRAQVPRGRQSGDAT
ncbi:MAG: hypothetical protein JXQ73_04780 [Phycisphaerae bacterium]|nr:hypothetical protein [Phycisphaerae bacterium]